MITSKTGIAMMQRKHLAIMKACSIKIEAMHYKMKEERSSVKKSESKADIRDHLKGSCN